MPKLTTTIKHDLGKDTAIERLKSKSEELQHEWAQQVSNVTQQWSGDLLEFGFKAFGFPIRGVTATTDDAVEVTMELPLAAIMFQAAIQSQIKKHLEELLA